MLNVRVKESKTKAQWCMIWMHGLGADGNDMAMLQSQMAIEDLAIRHVFVDAPIRPVTINNHYPMPAWYDILGADLQSREDEQGIRASSDAIEVIIEEQVRQGFNKERIFLAGFSQGGAMALTIALNNPAQLAGVISLSAYLPMARQLAAEDLQNKKNMPIFMAAGSHDPVVQVQWSRASHQFLVQQGFVGVAWHEYPMEHQVCLDEMNDLASWLRAQVTQ